MRRLVATTAYYADLLYKAFFCDGTGLPFQKGQGVLRKLAFVKKRILIKNTAIFCLKTLIFLNLSEKLTFSYNCGAQNKHGIK